MSGIALLPVLLWIAFSLSRIANALERGSVKRTEGEGQ